MMNETDNKRVVPAPGEDLASMGPLEPQAIRDLLESQDTRTLGKVLRKLHPADLGRMLGELSRDEKLTLFKRLTPAAAGEMLNEGDKESRKEIVEQADLKRVTNVVEKLPSDEAPDLLGDIDNALAERVLQSLDAGSSRQKDGPLTLPFSAGRRVSTGNTSSPGANRAASGLTP